MCGIAGIVDFNHAAIDRDVLTKMVAVQKHRGPDDEGCYYNDHVGLGHCRLSIIDLSANARQPMSNAGGTTWIVYNGEIYNYVELKKELADAGVKFRSASDTEVILAAYDRWHDGCLSRFNGMWAFAIWDSSSGELLLSRDRFGVKPLYYYYDGERLIFSSEIKALFLHPAVKKEVNDQAVYEYLVSGYGYMDVADFTFFKNIVKLKPGYAARIRVREKRVDFIRYWDLKPERYAGGEAKTRERFLDLFTDAIRLRLRSDVAVGITLSGGLDSSSIACLADKMYAGPGGRLYSFSSCFEDKDADERPYINEVLACTRLKSFFVSAPADQVFQDLEKIIWHQEEPYSTLSILPQWHVMKCAHEHDVKVLLTGQAGDETLAGYHKYYFYLFADLVKAFKWALLKREVEYYRAAKGTGDDIRQEVTRILASYYMPQWVRDIHRKRQDTNGTPYINKDFLGKHRTRIAHEKKFRSILNNDLFNGMKISPLPSLLHIDDRASMAHSVETRSPFLDYRLVQFLFSLPSEYKITDGQTKFLLRETMRGILPERVRARKDKMGFPTPLKAWLTGRLKNSVLELFTSQEFSKRPYFNREEVIREFYACLKGKDNHLTIWSLINLELWLRRFFP
ncbi:MAG: asparagine synthase (glutamine-hydrolyzing) [Candidatus Omnitrophica bacterium]|nr:asparagine synthase (glutamine-hydrolyzing) [Candidatus Omnitrophota bacterium]